MLEPHSKEIELVACTLLFPLLKVSSEEASAYLLTLLARTHKVPACLVDRPLTPPQVTEKVKGEGVKQWVPRFGELAIKLLEFAPKTPQLMSCLVPALLNKQLKGNKECMYRECLEP